MRHCKIAGLKHLFLTIYSLQIDLKISTVSAYYRKKGHTWGITKKGQESPAKRHSCGFLPLIYPNLGHLERHSSINGTCFWSF